MNPLEPAPDDHRSRWHQPFNITWLRDHQLFVGFVEHGEIALVDLCVLEVEHPYRASVDTALLEMGFPFAPYRGVLINAIRESGPCKVLRLYYARIEGDSE